MKNNSQKKYSKQKQQIQKRKQYRNYNLMIVICTIVVLFVTLTVVIKMYNHDIYQNNAVLDNTVCKKGEYFSEGKCLLCPVGSYCEDNIRYICPEGTGSLGESSSIMHCTKCAKGYYASGDGAGCVKCPSGMTTDTTGTTSIDYCK